MHILRGGHALIVGLVVLFGLAACSQSSPPPVESAATAVAPAIEAAKPAASAEGRFNPTEAVGGGAAGSSAVSADDLTRIFSAVPQASQLKVSANSSPPGATGTDVATVSVLAQDSGGVLKGLNADAKKTLGDAILTAAGTAWPNATVSLLVSDPAGGGGSIIGSRPKGGPNSILAT
jgi:hypothetical protein